MPAYKIEAMPGQDIKLGQDSDDYLYQIREYSGAGYVKDKRFSRIIRVNLKYDQAEKLIENLSRPKTE